ncbi:hypothetical protein HK100_010807 [Physocladia obscura]|uniref:NADP-dependent oxidoreductase domain-containing protein n=1 Tax=Physocladia obscura TaxID=109957 RepID=A0AAD5XKT4_9FUNG|nr:hypothetical protein HK100_010807 [Physocladia obscura]
MIRNVIPRTQQQVSCVGFGAFRIGGSGALNAGAALNTALKRGANVIDTSTHFGAGLSETLIGQTLREATREWGLKREDIVIISKCGHILDKKRISELSKEVAVVGEEFDLVVLSESAAHCISPKFIESEITASLGRLNVEKIDIYMLNCPERLVAGKLHSRKVPSVYPFIKKAFTHLEQEVKRGRIGSYGIASNSLANSSIPDFINLEECIDLAKQAGGLDHSFSSIEYPLNLFERDAVERLDGERVLAEIAEENGIYQFIQRPLNVIANGSVRCLGDRNSGYTDETSITAELTTRFENVTKLELGLSSLVGDTEDDIKTVSHFVWAETLSENLTKLVSSNAFATQHYTQNIVLPTLNAEAEKLIASLPADSPNGDDIKLWAAEYKTSITELCTLLVNLCLSAESAMNREIATVLGAMAPSTVQEWRKVKFTAQGKDVDMYTQPPLSDISIRIIRSVLEMKTNGRGGTVLVGMRKPEYVDDIILAGCGESVKPDDVESALLCSLLD